MHFRYQEYKSGHKYYSVQYNTELKMNYPILLLLLVSYATATSIGIHNRADDSAFHSKGRPNPEFFHRMGDWIRNAKNRIVNRLLGIDPSVVSASDETLGFDLLELRQRFKQDGMIPIDLSSLSVDPVQDWGFQVGDWYFIRKNPRTRNPYDENNGDDWGVYPLYPAFTLHDRSTRIMDGTTTPDNTPRDEITGMPEMTLPVLPLLPTSVSIPSAVTQFASDISTQMASGSPITEQSTTTPRLTTIRKRMEDNELGDKLLPTASVEIFM